MLRDEIAKVIAEYMGWPHEGPAWSEARALSASILSLLNQQKQPIMGTHQERKGAGGSESSCSASELKRPSEVGSSPAYPSTNQQKQGVGESELERVATLLFDSQKDEKAADFKHQCRATRLYWRNVARASFASQPPVSQVVDAGDFKAINFSVFSCNKYGHSFIYQEPHGLGAGSTYAGQRGNPVLIINNEPPVDVTSVEDAMTKANEFLATSNHEAQRVAVKQPVDALLPGQEYITVKAEWIDGKWMVLGLDEIDQEHGQLHRLFTPSDIYSQAQHVKSDGGLASAIHYPECWDTAAYPTLLSALEEIGCNPADCTHRQSLPEANHEGDE